MKKNKIYIYNVVECIFDVKYRVPGCQQQHNITIPNSEMIDTSLDKTEVVSVIYYSDDIQTHIIQYYNNNNKKKIS